MQLAGLPVCPADAAQEIKDKSLYISPITGGFGCVRDVIEKVLKLRNDWGEDTSVPSK
jgi:3-deoxy-D-manno-octulosonate 8-phosphate phosphatase (KDO 8-P phosphatase)